MCVFCEYILLITLLNVPEFIFLFFCTQLKSFIFYYKTDNLFAHVVCSIWPIDRTLSGTTTPGQSEPGSNGNEGMPHIPKPPKLDCHSQII